MHVFLVEDDLHLCEMMSLWLEIENINTSCFDNGTSLLRALDNSVCDLIILDWNLPDIQGDELLLAIRKRIAWETPVIFVSARTDKEDVVLALNNGANDYITKPVDRKEWVARVKLQLRQKYRLVQEAKKMLNAGNISIDYESRKIYVSDQHTNITPKEFKVAIELFNNIGNVVSREQMMKNVWGYSDPINSRTVDTHVSRVRKKLKLNPDNNWNLTSIYNYGYRLDLTKS